MEELVKTLSTHAGISPDTTRRGLGAILTFLRKHLSPTLYSQLERSVPDSSGLIETYEADNTSGSPGGMVGAVAGFAGNLLGAAAGEAGQLTAMLEKAGLDMSQISSFVPKAL